MRGVKTDDPAVAAAHRSPQAEETHIVRRRLVIRVVVVKADLDVGFVRTHPRTRQCLLPSIEHVVDQGAVELLRDRARDHARQQPIDRGGLGRVRSRPSAGARRSQSARLMRGCRAPAPSPRGRPALRNHPRRARSSAAGKRAVRRPRGGSRRGRSRTARPANPRGEHRGAPRRSARRSAGWKRTNQAWFLLKRWRSGPRHGSQRDSAIRRDGSMPCLARRSRYPRRASFPVRREIFGIFAPAP